MRDGIVDRRMLLLVIAFGGMFALLVGRLFYLQIIRHTHLSALALRQQQRTIEIQPERGSIYDRQGRCLAFNRQAASFYAVPGEIQNPWLTAKQLGQLTGVSTARLARRFQSRKAFVWIKRKVPEGVAARIRALNLQGIRELEEPQRVYPEGSLASHVLGFVGLDNQGLGGAELQFDRYIRGQCGWLRISRDARGQRLPTTAEICKHAQPGQDLMLTLDKVVQHVCERVLEQGLKSSGARAGSVVVMDPFTGEILAMANKPDFDPNRFNQFGIQERHNRALHHVFEPGSTFKLVAAAAALEEGVFDERDIIDCEQGRAVFEGRVVRDHEPQGRINFRDVMVYSSNIGIVKVGIRLGAERLEQYTRAFGFGHETGIELPGESRGLLKPLKYWRRWNTISVAFGQGLAVNTLQLAVAYAAVANGGLLVQPRVLKTLKRPDGVVSKDGRTQIRKRILSASTAERLRRILYEAVERGTGTQAQIPTYQVAGKTGTAQKPRSDGKGYDPVYHVSSFVGFFPVEKPRLLIAVVIDAPQGLQWGGWVAAPIFRDIGRELVAYCGIPPGPQKVFAFAQGNPKSATAFVPGMQEVPDIQGRSMTEAQNVLRAAGLQVSCLGKGERVQRQRPAGGYYIRNQSQVILYAAADPGIVDQVMVPDCQGQSMRTALQTLEAYGLKAVIHGSGVVQGQDPSAHAWTRVGEACLLKCEDPEGRP